MSLPDATAAAALEEAVVKPVWFAYLDFDTDPVRANTSGASIAVSGTGDADLDGFTFDGISAAIVDVSPVRNGASGSGSVTATLSGITGLDDDILALLADPSSQAEGQRTHPRENRAAANAVNVAARDLLKDDAHRAPPCSAQSLPATCSINARSRAWVNSRARRSLPPVPVAPTR